MKTLHHLSPKLTTAIILIALSSVGCADDEAVFLGGRLENPCNDAIPACGLQAACTLQNNNYYDGAFPGGLRILVRTETDNAQMLVRMLYRDMLFPGTELLVRAFEPGCGTFDEEHLQDIDLFDFAGDDRIIEFELDIPQDGDHLVEVFSDMTADYYLTVDIEERF